MMNWFIENVYVGRDCNLYILMPGLRVLRNKFVKGLNVLSRHCFRKYKIITPKGDFKMAIILLGFGDVLQLLLPFKMVSGVNIADTKQS